MLNYTSFMKLIIHDFIKYQTASQRWSDVSYVASLKTFENHCLKNFPDTSILTQEMIDSWCCQRDTESNNSFITRTRVIVTILKYTKYRSK